MHRFSHVSNLSTFCSTLHFQLNIHPSAVIDASATIAGSAKIGAGLYVGPNVKIRGHSILYPNVPFLMNLPQKLIPLWSEL
jgi:UDP-3-O-[3-hydroxymyristoyl] glucosamine N-acyltransferase